MYLEGCQSLNIEQIIVSIWNRLRDILTEMNSFSIKDILHDKQDFDTGLSCVDKTSKTLKMDCTLQGFTIQSTYKPSQDYNGKTLQSLFVNFNLKIHFEWSWNRKPFCFLRTGKTRVKTTRAVYQLWPNFKKS